MNGLSRWDFLGFAGSSFAGAFWLGRLSPTRWSTWRVIKPNQETREAQQFYVDRYVETYSQMEESMHKMSRHEASAIKLGVS